VNNAEIEVDLDKLGLKTDAKRFITPDETYSDD
jgi:hypothetical protein